MKKLVTLMALSWTMLASAQTASQFITAGRNDLTLTNWWGADTNFTAALGAPNGSTNEDANALKAVTRLLVLPQTPAGSNFLVALGFPKTNRWLPGFPLASLPKDANGEPVFPANYNSVTIISFFRTNILTAITNSAANLAAITDLGYTLLLSPNETLTESVTVDYGDIQMLRALLAAGQFAGYTLNANNFAVILPQVEAAMETKGLTYQWLLATYPNLLSLASAGDLTASEGALTNAIALYFAASDFIRNVRAPGATGNLFSLSVNDYPEEAHFRAVLTNVLLSLNAPTELSPDNADAVESTAYLGGYFAGTHSLRNLMPKFYGDSYINNTLPDYTFGGIVPDWPAYKTEKMLRKEFPSYAGIYIGHVSDLTFFDEDAGIFEVVVSTNGQATVVGYDYDSADNYQSGQAGGISAQFTIDQHGNWQFNSNSLAGVSGSGSFSKDGSFNGELDFTNSDSVSLIGCAQSVLQKGRGSCYDCHDASQFAGRTFQNAAGGYSGTWSGTFNGTSQSGTVLAGLTDAGYVVFSAFNHGAENDGGLGQLGSNNKFTTTSAEGSTVSGTLNGSAFQITGTSSNPYGSANWTMTRSTKVPFDVPPVITKDLFSSTNVVLGTNITFSLIATGSPPMSYQWYLNGNPIPGAMTNTLVASNLWNLPGVYAISATINNAFSGTNSQICSVTVGPEPFPPTNAIVSPTPGQLWSNAVFTVTGTARDNVAVSGVFCSVSNSAGAGPWTLATGTTSWNAPLTLVPGTNTVRAYAVNTSGISSTTNSVKLVYVVSAALTVRTNGLGGISPNDNGALLQIGNMYLLTATAATGFTFTNWTGGANGTLTVLTNGPALKFVMQSNLVLQVNFVETSKPTLTITAPTAGQHMTNAVAIVTGTASDVWAVNAVWYQLTNATLASGMWKPATTTNSYTNWAATVTLAAGSNTVMAYAVDLGGNYSATNAVSFLSSNSFKLLLGFGMAQPLASNGLNFVVQISTNLNGHVQVSTDFVNWATLANFTGTNTTINFRDAAATNFNQRFYRAVTP